MGLEWLIPALAGGATAAAGGMHALAGRVADETAQAEAARLRQAALQADTERFQEQMATSRDRAMTDEEARVMDLIGSGRFRLRPSIAADPGALPGAGASAIPGVPADHPLYGAIAGTGHRLRLADLEPVPADELMNGELSALEEKERIKAKYAPWQPRNKAEYIEARRAAMDPTGAPGREAYAMVQRDRLKTAMIDRALDAALGQFGGDLSQDTPDNWPARIANVLRANPDTRSSMRDGTINYDDIYAAIQRRKDVIAKQRSAGQDDMATIQALAGGTAGGSPQGAPQGTKSPQPGPASAKPAITRAEYEQLLSMGHSEGEIRSTFEVR